MRVFYLPNLVCVCVFSMMFRFDFVFVCWKKKKVRKKQFRNKNVSNDFLMMNGYTNKSCQLLIPLNDAIGINGERLLAFARNDEACTRRNESNVLILLRAKNLLLLISLAILRCV